MTPLNLVFEGKLLQVLKPAVKDSAVCPVVHGGWPLWRHVEPLCGIWGPPVSLPILITLSCHLRRTGTVASRTGGGPACGVVRSSGQTIHNMLPDLTAPKNDPKNGLFM